MEKVNDQKRPGPIKSRDAELKKFLNEVLPKAKINSAKVKMVA